MDLNNATPDGLARRQSLRLDPEQLVRLAEALPRHERKLIEGRFADGLTYRDLARKHHTAPRRMRRRIDKLAQRMHQPEFRFTLLHAGQLPPALRKTAKLLFLHGRSMRDTALATGHTLHRVRTDRSTLQTLARAGV